MRHRLFEARLPGWIDPADVFAALFAGEKHAVWLDTAGATGTSYLGRGSRLATASVADGTVTLDGVTAPGTIFEMLRAELPGSEIPFCESAGNDVAGADDDTDTSMAGGFRLGWIGWLGYELRSQTLGQSLARSAPHPDAALLFLDSVVAFDHATHTMRVLSLDSADLAGLSELITSVRPVAKEPRTSSVSSQTWADTDAEYLAKIADCQAAIRDGEAYQLCLTTEVRVDIRPDPLQTYLALRESSPSHHGSYFRVGDVALLSASPEQFLTVSPSGVVESKPIKGTRPRGATLQRDAELAAELLADDKERAENLMIVDLMRNDISRVSAVGSVTVPSLLAVETYAHVHQLVSCVRGTLAKGLGAMDAVVACFPAGSMTGAPKRRATEILDGLESRARGIYAGAFGYFSLDGRVDLAMVIRSIVLDRHGATIGTGGGITALSVPSEELLEVKLKAAALLAVLGARHDDGPPGCDSVA